MTAEMTSSLMNWLSPTAMQSMGWALLHFLWQGTALAALAAAAMALCRRASTRYLLGVGALVLMLLAPLATFFFYSEQHSGVADTAKSSPLAAAAWPIARGNALGMAHPPSVRAGAHWQATPKPKANSSQQPASQSGATADRKSTRLNS